MTMPTTATGSRLGGRTGTPQVSWGKSKGGQTPFSMQQFTPEQMNLFKSLFGHLGPDSFLGKLAGGDQGAFEGLEAPAWRDFQSGMGALGSRFAGTGGQTSALKSSGFRNTATAGASQFAQDLQSQRLGLQNQAIKDLMSMSNQLLEQRPNMQGFMKKAPSIWQKILGMIGGAGGQFAGGLGGGLFGNRMKDQSATWQSEEGKV